MVVLFILRCRFPKNKSLNQVIRSRYDNHVVKSTRKFEKLDFKVRKCMLDIEFLESCLLYDVTPTFLRFKLSNPRLLHSRTYKECQKKLLRQEITLKNIHLTKLNNELEKIRDEHKNVYSYFDWVWVGHITSKFNIN